MAIGINAGKRYLPWGWKSMFSEFHSEAAMFNKIIGGESKTASRVNSEMVFHDLAKENVVIERKTSEYVNAARYNQDGFSRSR